MKLMSMQNTLIVSGGCDSCKESTLEMLNQCDYSQLQFINALFKSVILSEEMRNADDDALIKALTQIVKENYL